MADSRPHWLELDGQVCAVTGAASGIGAAIARSLARAGARVVLLDRDAAGCQKVAAELLAGGATALAVTCDTSSEASVNAAAQRVLAELGPCYALINNAGMLRPGGLADVSLADWNAVLAVNLTGYLLCARAFSAQMRQAGRGSIVNVASISALTPQTHSGAYSASKAGVLLLSRQMAVEWGPFGVRSNAICPGMIRTPLTEPVYQDVGAAVAYLASAAASYVTGHNLVVDGGISDHMLSLIPGRPGQPPVADAQMP